MQDIYYQFRFKRETDKTFGMKSECNEFGLIYHNFIKHFVENGYIIDEQSPVFLEYKKDNEFYLFKRSEITIEVVYIFIKESLSRRKVIDYLIQNQKHLRIDYIKYIGNLYKFHKTDYAEFAI